MRKEIEKLLVRVNWQIDSLEKSWNNEMESMKYEVEIGNVNYVKTTCERIEQIRRELAISFASTSSCASTSNVTFAVTSKVTKYVLVISFTSFLLFWIR